MGEQPADVRAGTGGISARDGSASRAVVYARAYVLGGNYWEVFVGRIRDDLAKFKGRWAGLSHGLTGAKPD